jgi:predicted O-methyltransferase YrrM
MRRANLPLAVQSVLDDLEARSRREQPELEALRSQGGSALRDRASDFMLDVGPEVGQLLNMLVRMLGAKTVVEVGSSVGYSTLWMAEAVQSNGGTIVAIEPDPEKRRQLRENLERAELSSVVELPEGDTVDIIGRLPGPFDLVFLDHWKELYAREFALVWPKLRRGGVVAADNIIIPAKNRAAIEKYQQLIHETPDARTLTLELGDGVELTVRE